MARNGSGQYDLPVNSWNPATNGNAATTVDWQDLIDDVASALTQSVSADGQTPMTGSLNMNGNKVENLADGVANDDAATLGQIYNQGIEQDLASAATTDIGSVNSNFIRITGTTTITSLGTNYKGPKFVRFSAALTLTHNATTLILPGGANITTAAGDRAIFVPKGNPADGWNCVVYEYATGDKVTGDFFVTAKVGVNRTTVPTDVNMIIDQAGTSTIPTITNPAGLVVANSAATGSSATVSIISGATGTASLFLGNSSTQAASGVAYNSNTSTLIFRTGGSNAGTIDNSNRLIMNAVSPATAVAGSFITSGRIQSDASYSVTTATAANLVVASDGLFARSTSALKYKQDIQPISEDHIKAYLGMSGFTYRSKSEGDDQTKRHFGLAADDAHNLGLTELVTYGQDGEVEGYNYGRDTSILLEIVKRLITRIEALEAKNAN